MPSNEAIQQFQRRGSVFQRELNRSHTDRCDWTGAACDPLFAGIAMQYYDHTAVTVAIAIRDTTYLIDFFQQHSESQPGKELAGQDVTDFIVTKLRNYSHEHLERFVGVGMPYEIANKCPKLCSRIWHELDIVPIALPQRFRVSTSLSPNEVQEEAREIDELAESMSRRCVRFFGPANNPVLDVGYQGLVEVDCAYRIRIATLDDYKPTVGSATWEAVNHYARELKERRVKIAFFSATPQGGGVALMRHALVRFARTLGLDLKWYVPKPRPGVFRITKTNHNILQGVSAPDERFTPEDQQVINDWLHENAERYWVASKGPLLAPEQGGADLVIIDDPQMPSLIPIAKEQAPNRPVIFRSHIQIRSDLVKTPGTPQHDAWAWMWDRIKLADVFISHPVEAFVPMTVPKERVGYMPATTDWLDGLNKTMQDWEIASYGRAFNTLCYTSHVPTINYPDDEYIIQIARFDPSKGIRDVLESYASFIDLLQENDADENPPKLLICGHGSVDDPDGNNIYDATLSHIETRLPHLKKMICVMRLGPLDQILNALLSKAKIVLQLSTREGFEVKVSEAIHKGKPVIATRAGGIPLQVEDQQNGFLVEVGDTEAVARRLFDLWTDEELYARMSATALKSVSDEVTTVGNALSWLYLASQLTQDKTVEPRERWINDMAREEVGIPYGPNENRLKRAVRIENMG